VIGQRRRWGHLPLAGANASVAGLCRQLGTTWNTVWSSIKPLLAAADVDESRFEGVTILGVDEHVVRHEALLFRMEVRDLHRLAVAAAG
jgi:hypothetical protein